MNKILIDTNAYSNYLRGDAKVLEVLSQSSVVYLSVIVMGELLTGFKCGTKNEANVNYLKRFAAKSTVNIFPVSEETAEIFSEVMFDLKKHGTPIPINDVWIAAQAIETGSVLITFDRHFEKIKHLRCRIY